MSVNEYSFVTVWKIAAPLKDVWDAIFEIEKFPNWWKAAKNVEVLEPGDGNGVNCLTQQTWTGMLPYKITFKSRRKAVDYLKKIEIASSGNLQGEGIWTFTEEDGVVTVQYKWEIETTSQPISFLTKIFKPLLIKNHDEIMRSGANGLAEKLNAKLIES